MFGHQEKKAVYREDKHTYYFGERTCGFEEREEWMIILKRILQ
jgi:hypothetical protein